MEFLMYSRTLTGCLFLITIALSLSDLLPCNAEPTAARIDYLILLLASDSFSEREKAMEALQKIGREALPALRRAQKNEDPEILRRVTLLIRQIDRSAQALRNRGATVSFYGGQKPSPLSVRTVHMEGAAFGDDDLINLRECKNLELLGTSGASITDAGLDYIKYLSSLQTLFLSGTSVSNLTSLRNLTMLTHLDLSGSKITDAGLAPVKHFPNLLALNLCGTQIIDAGFAHLTCLKNLRQLDLSKTTITDKGLAHLKGLKELEYLRLNDTQITDAGLLHLKELKKLKYLFLHRTKTTTKGINDLKDTLPDWKNYRSSAANVKK